MYATQGAGGGKSRHGGAAARGGGGKQRRPEMRRQYLALIALASVAAVAITSDAPPPTGSTVTVSTIAGGLGGGCRRGGRSGYQDGDARTTALFNRPSRVQAVTMPGSAGEERLFVLDDENGCVRSMPLQQPPNRTLVRSDTPCAAASTIGHNRSDVVFPNGTSRGESLIRVVTLCSIAILIATC